jgi:hypothetical protein
VSIQGYEIDPSGILPSPGTSAIVINAGANDVINLRGLTFDGATASGTSGVVFNSGAHLHVEDCTFSGFTASGLTLSPGTGSANPVKVVVHDSQFADNATGLLIMPTANIAASVELKQLRIANNTGEGLRIDGTGGTGAIRVAISNSSTSFNATNGIDAVSGPGSVTLNVERVTVLDNGTDGILSNQSSGGTASVTVGSSVLYGNGVAAQAVAGASLASYGNNQVTGNGTNGTFTGTANLQ